MDDVGDEEGGEQRAHDLLLQGRVGEKILPRSAEDEEVDEAEQADDVCELEHRHLRRFRQGCVWCVAGRPRGLRIVSLPAAVSIDMGLLA